MLIQIEEVTFLFLLLLIVHNLEHLKAYMDFIYAKLKASSSPSSYLCKYNNLAYLDLCET